MSDDERIAALIHRDLLPMTHEPQSNDAPALLAAIEADYAAAKQNLEFQRGHRDANFEDGYKQCMDQWMPALRLVFAELEQAKREQEALRAVLIPEWITGVEQRAAVDLPGTLRMIRDRYNEACGQLNEATERIDHFNEYREQLIAQRDAALAQADALRKERDEWKARTAQYVELLHSQERANEALRQPAPAAQQARHEAATAASREAYDRAYNAPDAPTPQP